MIEININELCDTMISEGKEQEFNELIDEFNNKENQAKYIEYLGQIDEENKLTLTTIFDDGKETYKLVRVADLKEDADVIEFYFLSTLQDLIYSNKHVKYALLNPNEVRKNYFEVVVEK